MSRLEAFWWIMRTRQLTEQKWRLYLKRKIIITAACLVSEVHIHKKNLFNRPFPNYLKPLSQSESWCTTIHMKMSLICKWMKSHFHMKEWAPRLALRKRLKVIRKWPIRFLFFIRDSFWWKLINLLRSRSDLCHSEPLAPHETASNQHTYLSSKKPISFKRFALKISSNQMGGQDFSGNGKHQDGKLRWDRCSVYNN